MNKMHAAGATETEHAHCRVHGPYEARFVLLANQRLGGECPKCVAEEDARRTEDVRQKERERRREHLLSSCGIPERFQGATFANFTPPNTAAGKIKAACERYCESWPERRAEGSSLIFSGSVGTGKSHLACATAQELIRRYTARVRYTGVAEVMRRIRSSYSPQSQTSEEEILQRLWDLDLLILDELGVQLGSDHEHMMLFEVINGRYLARRPTILVTNLGVQELETTVGARLVDRMREHGAVFKFSWESQRGRAA